MTTNTPQPQSRPGRTAGARGVRESKQINQCTTGTISAPQHDNEVGGEETKDRPPFSSRPSPSQPQAVLTAQASILRSPSCWKPSKSRCLPGPHNTSFETMYKKFTFDIESVKYVRCNAMRLPAGSLISLVIATRALVLTPCSVRWLRTMCAGCSSWCRLYMPWGAKKKTRETNLPEVSANFYVLQADWHTPASRLGNWKHHLRSSQRSLIIL